MADTERFQLEGSAPQFYEQSTVPRATKPQAELMFEHVTLNEGDRVLDVACGTGIVTRIAVERYGNIRNIVGVDLNAGMLEVARENTPTTDIPVEWRQGDMCALPLPDGSFDVALCNHGLQFVPDKLTALREMHRVLAPNGRLVFTVWSDATVYHAALADALTRYVSADAAKSCLSPFSWSDADTIQQFVSDVGFCDIEMRVLEFMRHEKASAESIVSSMARMPIAGDIAALSEETRMAIGQEVDDALQAYLNGDDFVMPSQSHLVQARVA